MRASHLSSATNNRKIACDSQNWSEYGEPLQSTTLRHRELPPIPSRDGAEVWVSGFYQKLGDAVKWGPVRPVPSSPRPLMEITNQRAGSFAKACREVQRLPNTFLNNFGRDNGCPLNLALLGRERRFQRDGVSHRLRQALLGRGRIIDLAMSCEKRSWTRPAEPIVSSRCPNGCSG
jgi:hypothetical protein